MTYQKTTDTSYNYNKIYYVMYDNFVYRLIVDKKTKQGYMFYCDGTFYALCTINFENMTVTYKEQTLDILEAKKSSSGVFRFLGEVDSYDDLPKDAEIGDVYQVPPDKEYAWDGEKWVLLGFNMDLSEYAKISYVDAQDNINADNIKKVQPLVVTLTDNKDGTYTSDTKYEKIKAAFDSNQNIIVKADAGILPLMSAEINSNGASFTFGYTKIGTDGEYITTFSIHYLHTEASGDIEARDEWLEETEVEEYLKLSGGTLEGNLNMGANAILDVQKLHIDGQAPLYFGQVIEKAIPNKPRLTGVVNSNAAAFVKSDSQVDYVPLFIGTPIDKNHATTKDYVDTLTSTKLTAVTDPANNDKVYGVTTDGTQKMFSVAETLTVNAIPVRDSEGALYVGPPTDEYHAVNISYLESTLTRKQDVFAEVTQENGDYNIGLQGENTTIGNSTYSMQFGSSTFAISNPTLKHYLTFDNEGKLSLSDENGPILPTSPQDLVVKKYVDDSFNAVFNYDADTKTLTITTV
mgnify:CR=1 FL=1